MGGPRLVKPTDWPAEKWQDYPCLPGRSRRDTRSWRKILGDPGGLWFLHRCHDLTCRQVYHIYIGTASDNLKDAYTAGRRDVVAIGAAISATNRGRNLRPNWKPDPEELIEAQEWLNRAKS